MRTVPLKSTDDQAATIIVKHRELMVNQRAQAINALRGHAAEFGIIAAKGCANVTALLAILFAEDAILATAKLRKRCSSKWASISSISIVKINALEKQLSEQHKANAGSKLLAAFPGSGQLLRSPWRWL